MNGEQDEGAQEELFPQPDPLEAERAFGPEFLACRDLLALAWARKPTEATEAYQLAALRCYPAAARRFRQSGDGQVRFCLDPAGALKDSTVAQSTGSELLDEYFQGRFRIVEEVGPYRLMMRRGEE